MSVSIQQCLGIAPDHAHYLPSAVLPSNNLVGIEVELENVPRDGNQPLKYWTITRDGSLRNNGVEFILSHPTCGQTLIDAISELGTYLKKFSPDASDRTSLHVHLDFRSSTVDQIFQFCMMYAVLERTLIKYAGGEARSNSIYCIPLHKSYETMIEMSRLNDRAITAKHSKRAKDIIVHECATAVNRSEKYAACNIKPLGNFGSIEIRIHKGEKDPARILEWVQMLLALKLYTDTVEIDFDDMFNHMSSDGCSGIIHNVFGSSVSRDLLVAQDGVEHDLSRGMRVAQDILHMWPMRDRGNVFPTELFYDGDGGHPLLKKKPQRTKPERKNVTKYYINAEGDRREMPGLALQEGVVPAARPGLQRINTQAPDWGEAPVPPQVLAVDDVDDDGIETDEEEAE